MTTFACWFVLHGWYQSQPLPSGNKCVTAWWPNFDTRLPFLSQNDSPELPVRGMNFKRKTDNIIDVGSAC